jgi:serine phosphatase RsbU (regulator of sigma subunit)
MHLEILDVRTIADQTPKRVQLEFHNQPISIGSHSANTVQLPDLNVAEYHAMIVPVGDGTDEWAYRPTTREVSAEINGEPVADAVAIKDGDVLRITHFEISFKLDPPLELDLPEPTNVGELAKIKQFPLPPRADVRHGDDDITLTPALQTVLADFSIKLRGCEDFPQVLERTIEFLLPELRARMVWIGIRRKKSGDMEVMAGRTADGKEVAEPWMLEGFIYRCMSRGQFIRLPSTKQPKTQSLIAVPIPGKRGPLGLILTDTRRRTRVFDEGDLHLVTVVSRFVAAQLEAIIDEQTTQRERLEAGERALLHGVQALLDPKNVPEFKNLQFAAYSRPGTETVGDIYDVMKLPNGLAAIMLAHVSAGTTRTALAMAEARAAFRTAALHADAPHIKLRTMDWLLYDRSDPCKLDVAIWIMNPKTGAAEFSTAGAVRAVVVDARGNPRSLADPSIPPVGTTKDYQYQPRKERLKDGEMLAFLSPGCGVARDQSGEILGWKHVVETLCDTFGQPAPVALTDFLADLSPFFKDGRPPADITVLLVRREER